MHTGIRQLVYNYKELPKNAPKGNSRVFLLLFCLYIGWLCEHTNILRYHSFFQVLKRGYWLRIRSHSLISPFSRAAKNANLPPTSHRPFSSDLLNNHPTISKTPLAVLQPASPLHHSHPLPPTHRKISTKPSYWLTGRYQMGTECFEAQFLHSGTNMRPGSGLHERHRYNQREAALQRLPRADSHWTSLRNVWLEIAWDYVTQYPPHITVVNGDHDL